MNYFGLFFSFFLPGLIIGMWLGMGVKETRRDLDEIDHSGNREYVDDRIMRAIERLMQRKLDTATPIDMVAAADLLNVVNEVLK